MTMSAAEEERCKELLGKLKEAIDRRGLMLDELGKVMNKMVSSLATSTPLLVSGAPESMPISTATNRILAVAKAAPSADATLTEQASTRCSTMCPDHDIDMPLSDCTTAVAPTSSSTIATLEIGNTFITNTVLVTSTECSRECEEQAVDTDHRVAAAGIGTTASTNCLMECPRLVAGDNGVPNLIIVASVTRIMVLAISYSITNIIPDILVDVLPGYAVTRSGQDTLLFTGRSDELTCVRPLCLPDGYKVFEKISDTSKVLLWPPPMKWDERQLWPPPSRVEIKCGGEELRPTPWPSFACNRVGLQLKPPWPPPVKCIGWSSWPSSEYFAGYLLEQSLSVDNLFVFVLVFKYFKMPQVYKNRALSYGIAGAVRIILGAATIQRFEAVNLLLALILLFSSYKLFADEDGESDLSDNFMVKTCQKFIPVTDYYDGDRTFTNQYGLWNATPLLLTVAVIELSDIAFAVDSIPAVFGVTKDPLIILSSNIFAISGLRSLYVLISESMSELEYLHHASGEELRVGACLGEHYNATWCAVEYYESSGEILKLLLDKAPWLLENPNKGQNLLCHAILCQNPNAVSLLLQTGANPRFPIMTKGRHVSHPIHLAARLGYAPVLMQLMANGAEINAQTSTGDTPLMECGKPTLLSFSAREVSDGTLFKTIEDYDPQSKGLIHQLEKYYQGDPVLNPLTPWERPPIKNVFCIYGIDSKTEVGYYFALSGKPYPDNWIITDVIYEFEGSLLSRSGNSVSGKPNNSSGDGTVSYNSLSWCKNWLGPKVNITRAPQAEHDGSDLQTRMNVERYHGQDLFPNMTRLPHVKYITYYEDAESIPGWRTAVWELDKANHRNIVRMPVLMRELWLEMWHDMHPDSNSKFVTKAFRGPLRNEDCHWDYAKARCGFLEHCEYRYTFGDVHLGMSCRLKDSSTGKRFRPAYRLSDGRLGIAGRTKKSNPKTEVKSAQELLDEVVNVWKSIKQKAQKEHAEAGKAIGKETDGGLKSEGVSSNPQESGANAAPEHSTAEKKELQNKIAKLMAIVTILLYRLRSSLI